MKISLLSILAVALAMMGSAHAGVKKPHRYRPGGSGGYSAQTQNTNTVDDTMVAGSFEEYLQNMQASFDAGGSDATMTQAWGMTQAGGL